jgi:hypothetical protein
MAALSRSGMAPVEGEGKARRKGGECHDHRVGWCYVTANRSATGRATLPSPVCCERRGEGSERDRVTEVRPTTFCSSEQKESRRSDRKAVGARQHLTVGWVFFDPCG